MRWRGRPWPRFRALDVRTLARLAAPTLADHSLDRLCEWLGIESKGRHTAIGDARGDGRRFPGAAAAAAGQEHPHAGRGRGGQPRLAEARRSRTGGYRPATSTGPADATRALARIDSFPYRHRVRDVMSAPALFAPPDTTVREAVRLLIDKQVSSVFVRTASGVTGIVTERDLLRAIDDAARRRSRPPSTHHEGAAADRRARTSSSIARSAASSGWASAIWASAMRRGEIVGAVTTRNLLRHRATTAHHAGRRDRQRRARRRRLAAAWARLPLMARSLMDEDVDPRTIAAVVSSEICAMTRRAAELAEQRMQQRRPGRAARPLRGAGAGLGRPRREPARRRPGQRHRLRRRRRRRPRGPLLRDPRRRT